VALDLLAGKLRGLSLRLGWSCRSGYRGGAEAIRSGFAPRLMPDVPGGAALVA